MVTAVAADWYPVALHLGVEQSLIGMVKADNHDNCQGACRDLFKKWLKGDYGSGKKERTWRTVVDALKESGYRTQAEELIRQMVDPKNLG